MDEFGLFWSNFSKQAQSMTVKKCTLLLSYIHCITINATPKFFYNAVVRPKDVREIASSVKPIWEQSDLGQQSLLLRPLFHNI